MRAEFIYEKFKEESDPIKDMGIGVPGILEEIEKIFKELVQKYKLDTSIDFFENGWYIGYSIQIPDDNSYDCEYASIYLSKNNHYRIEVGITCVATDTVDCENLKEAKQYLSEYIENIKA